MYDVYDVFGETAAERRTDEKGDLEVFLSGRFIRLLYVTEAAAGPKLIFTTGERRDGQPRFGLPARIHAYRPGRSVITGIPKTGKVYLNGMPVPVMETFDRGHQTVLLPKGYHLLEVR